MSVTAWQLVAPWVILAVWLAADLSTVIYWALNEWGFLGDLVLIIALALHLFGLLVWVTAFTLLADLGWKVRLAYFLLGGAAHIGMLAYVFQTPSQQLEMAIAAAAFAVGWSIPFLWLRRRGWRIAAATSPSQPQPVWQFTIGDMLVATAQVGAMCGLTLASIGISSPGELVVCALLLLGSPAVVIIGLAWRSFWLAALACLLLCAIMTLLPMWWLADNFTLWEAGMVLAIVGLSALSLLAAIGCMRRADYRLR